MSQRTLVRAALNGSESRATDPSVPRRSTLVGPLSEWTYCMSQRTLVRAALNGSESRATDLVGPRRSTLVGPLSEWTTS
jgi:hypothetical protein